MASAYELVAETRPRIRRDTLFTKTPEGVLFHNAQGGFRVDSKTAYRFVSLLVPHFNGKNKVADICGTLGPQQREMVGDLVKALYERNFARDVPPGSDTAELSAEVTERFAAQISYIDHYVDSSASRFERFRECRVAVLGTGPVARWCVSGLIRNGCAHVAVTPGVESPANRYDEVLAEAAELAEAGCPVEIGSLPGGTAGSLGWSDLSAYDIVVVAGGPTAGVQVNRLLAAGLPAGRTLLPAWTLGPRAVVGPLTAAGTAGCWACAALRLGGNGDGDAAATLWRQVTLPGSAPAFGEPAGAVAAMLGNLLGYEVFRLVTGALPAETRGKVIIQNLESLDVLTETLLPHPGCPYCGQESSATGLARLRAVPAEEIRALGDAAMDGTMDAEGGPGDADAAADALVAELNDRMVLFGRHAGVFTRYSDEPWTQLPLKASTVRLSPGHRGPREIAAFDVHHVAGARRRALHAAAGVYAEYVRAAGSDAEPRSGVPPVDPALVSIASGVQGSPVEPRARTEAASLLTGDRWLVPVAAVHPFGPENDAGIFTPTRAGTGAGASLAEAVQRGVLSALCFPALLRASRGAAEVARIALDTLDGSPELAFLAKSAHNLGVEVELLDLGEGFPGAAHVLLARSMDQHGGAAEWALAGHPDWTRGAVAAMRDLLGRVQLGRQLAAGRSVDDGDPMLAGFDAGTLTAGTERPARLDVRGSLGDVLDGLRGAGYDVLVVPTTPADLRAGGIETVRVLLTVPAGR